VDDAAEWVLDVERARSGDRAAQKSIIERFLPLARATAARLVAPADVDDVVQDAIASVLHSLSRLRVAAAFPAMLRFAVRKQARVARSRAAAATSADGLSGAVAAIDPATVAEERDLARRLAVALGDIRDDDRRLRELRYLAGWTPAEIADLLGTSDGAIRKRLFDAHRRARPHLEHLNPKETAMTDPRTLLGAVHPADLQPGDLKTPRLQPASNTPTATGLKVIDSLAPVRRGGTIEIVGPVGTGHLVLAFELLHRLSGRSAATALVAVGGPDGSDPADLDLRPIVADDSLPGRAAVIHVDDPADARRAIDTATRLATSLAGTGLDTALLISGTALRSATQADLTRASGLTDTGAVTTIAARTLPRGAPLPASVEADATLALSLEQFVLGIYPALDPTRSSSRFPVSAEADAARAMLADAARLRAWFGQAMYVAADYTGVAGNWLDPDVTAAELAALVS
jgi:RNA polymerase sigma-70 factor (ECF subfamily)